MQGIEPCSTVLETAASPQCFTPVRGERALPAGVGLAHSPERASPVGSRGRNRTRISRTKAARLTVRRPEIGRLSAKDVGGGVHSSNLDQKALLFKRIHGTFFGLRGKRQTAGDRRTGSRPHRSLIGSRPVAAPTTPPSPLTALPGHWRGHPLVDILVVRWNTRPVRSARHLAVSDKFIQGAAKDAV